MGEERYNVLHEKLHLLLGLEGQMANPLHRPPQSFEMVSVVKAFLDGEGGAQVGKALVHRKDLDGGALYDQMNRP